MFQVIIEKILPTKGFISPRETFLDESNCNCSSYKFSYKFAFISLFSCRKNRKARVKFLAGLWSFNREYIFYSELRSTSKACRIQQILEKKFIYYYYSYYGFMPGHNTTRYCFQERCIHKIVAVHTYSTVLLRELE